MGNALGWVTESTEEKAWNAARDGDLRTLQAACSLSAGAMEWRETERGRSPFIMACSHGHVECVRWLVDNGIDVYGRDYRGNTPLHYACTRGQPTVVEILMATVDFTPFTLNAKGLSPLDSAREMFTDATDDRDTSLAERIATCIELLEARCIVHDSLMYAREDNALSSVIGIAALRSWSIKHAKVFRTSSNIFLELALFTMPDELGQRSSPVPSSTYLVLVDPVNRPTTFVKQASATSWLRSSRSFGFSLLVGAKTTATVPALYWQEFAAVDLPSLNAWTTFFLDTAVTKVADPALSVDRQFHTQMLGRSIAYTSYVAPTATIHEPQPEDIEDSNGVVIAQLLSLAPRTTTSAKESSTAVVECVICCDAPQTAVCVPCGHNVLCMMCAYAIASSTSQCPVCRQYVREVIQVYRN
ncbi:hypothetical protein H310_11213 [Aphanomyces invadans]|uniref:RING-type domain-containing protein n=1 Tax=Aphanomyces invadans TaxID=157072 RepID=A0A024TNW8_9STRA|nr:hypothetical protein H310_11213 [Aphanomyces invadans]ETV95316.1 hypothetical protein H310_11213 [Aphanomyces invadans]|eukprot:XP_008876017.1 hypothetical protein H310_11213 [Aphanomyces invadans]